MREVLKHVDFILPNKYITAAYQTFMLHADTRALIPGLALCCQDSLFFLVD